MIEDEAEHQITCVEDYLTFLQQFDAYRNQGKLFYRAQLASFQTVIPSIAHGKYSKLYEVKRLEKSNLVSGTDRFYNIAYGQHQGVPTRFLDFTVDPLVALFFAVSPTVREDSVIFIFIKPSLRREDLHIDLLTKLAFWGSTDFSSFVKSFNEQLSEPLSEHNALTLATKPVFVDRHSIVDAGNLRMCAQSGTFAICSNVIEDGRIKEISGIESTESFLTIAIPFEYKAKLRRELSDRNYTPDKMFADDRSREFPRFEKAKGSLQSISEIVDSNINRKGLYSKYGAHIALNGLFTVGEITEYARRFAYSRAEDRVWLWFARDRVNALQHRNNLVLTADIMKKSFPSLDLLADESFLYHDGYVPISNYYSNPNNIRSGQKIPVSKKARYIKMSVTMTSSRITIKTNLFNDAKLFFSSDQIKALYSDEFVVHQGRADLDIRVPLELSKGNFLIVLTYPSTQTRAFLAKSGIQYENIDSPAFKRTGLFSPTAEWHFSYAVLAGEFQVGAESIT